MGSVRIDRATPADATFIAKATLLVNTLQLLLRMCSIVFIIIILDVFLIFFF